MTYKEFMEAEEPITFFCSVHPVTGAHNYEYLEDENWDGYIESIKKDFPDCFHFIRRNPAAKDKLLKRLGLGQ